MKPIIALSLLLFQCAPESHTLLGGDASPEPGTPVFECEDAETESIHGTPCPGDSGGCGFEHPFLWWAECVQGEFVAVRGTGHSELVSEEAEAACTGEIEIGTSRASFESIDGPCSTIHVCDGRTYELCHTDGRPGVRPDAIGMAPWTDCEAALADARDGDPCSGALRCSGRRSLGGSTSVSLVLYCDEDGVTRLIGGSGFDFIHP